MAHVKYIGPVLPDVVYDTPMPMRIGVNGYDGTDGLGDFWSRLVKKTPRIIAGAGTSVILGGRGETTSDLLLTAAAGGVAAAIPKRKKGSSLLKDIAVGAGMGAIPGTVIGTYRGLTKPLGTDVTKIGLAGKATQFIEQKFFPRKLTAAEHGPPVSPDSPRLVSPTKTATQKVVDVVTSKQAQKVATAGAALLLPVIAGSMGGGSGTVEPVVSTGGRLQGQTQPYYGSTANGGGYVEEGGYYLEDGTYVPPTTNGVQYIATGGGGGMMIPMTDPETGKTIMVPRPSFWQQYKTYIMIGAGVLVGGAVLYKAFKN